MDELAEQMMLEAYERIREYESRDSFQKLKELRDEGQKILNRYYKKYREEVSYFKKEAEKNTDHERYAKGHDLPRGVLCPGNMAVLTIGNIKREHFSKKPAQSGYVYGYDKEDHLIWADMITEFIRNGENLREILSGNQKPICC